jgi:hypothetical protein
MGCARGYAARWRRKTRPGGAPPNLRQYPSKLAFWQDFLSMMSKQQKYGKMATLFSGSVIE